MDKDLSKPRKRFWSKKTFMAAAIIAVAALLTLFGINAFKRPEPYQLALDNIAEARFYLKTAESENPIGTVHLYSGLREKDFQADGIATEPQAFTVLSVEPKDETAVVDGKMVVEIKLNDEEPETYTLEKNPYGNNYACDLGKSLDESMSVTVTFKAGTETVGTVELKNSMPENSIKWETALEIASKEMADKINTGSRIETSTKILCDNQTADTPYWFVTFITENGDRYFVVVSHDGKVIGTNQTK